MADAFSLIQFKDLPTFTGTLSENATLVAVLDNTRTVRIDWDILNSGLIKGSADEPSSTYASGEQGNLYVGSTGLYSYSDGSWGKSPRYTENWDDLAPGVRFLRVDGSQSLSSTEKSRAIDNIGLTIASADSAGLVKAWGNPTALTDVAPVIINTDGTQYVSKATEGSLGVVDLAEVATRTYVGEAIDAAITTSEELPIATSTVPGVVMSDAPLTNEDGVFTGDGVFTVGENGKVTIRPASLYSYEETEEGITVKEGLPGIYNITDVNEDQTLLYAPTLRLVRTMVESGGGVGSIPVATTTQVGGVRAWSNYTGTPMMYAPVVTNTAGLQFVLPANNTALGAVLGAVRVVNNGDDVTADFGAASGFTVPTTHAMVSFVEDNFPKLDDEGKVSASNLPLATSTDAGIIKGSGTVNIDSSGAAHVPIATISSRGVVRLASAKSTGELSNDAGATTASHVINYVNYVLDSGPFVSTTTYDTYVTNTDASIEAVENDLTALTNNVNTIESDVSALKNAESGEAFLSTASTVIEVVNGWVKYTGNTGRLVTFNGAAEAGYVATLTFQTEVPVTFGGTILWDNDESPYVLPVAGYVFQITSLPGETAKLGRKVMEYKPEGAIYLKPAEGVKGNANVRGFSFASSASGFLRGVGFKQRSDNDIPTTNIPLWCKIWINDVFAGLSTNSVSMRDTAYPFYTFDPIEINAGDVLKVMFFEEEGISSTSITDETGSLAVGALCYAKLSTDPGGILGAAGQLTNSQYTTVYECRLSST